MRPGADPGFFFFLGGGQTKVPNRKLRTKPESKRPSIEGEARVEGTKRPINEGEARTEGEAREKAGGEVWEGSW